MDTRKWAAKLAQKINHREKGFAKVKGKGGYKHLWETVLKGKDKREKEKKKKKEEERAEGERTGARAVPVRRDLAG